MTQAADRPPPIGRRRPASSRTWSTSPRPTRPATGRRTGV